VSRFNRKKSKAKVMNGRVFARLVPGGKWHIAIDDEMGRVQATMYFPCRPWPECESDIEDVAAIYDGPLNGFIFAKPHKICGTCKKMERNRHIMKSAGFDM
jgi:hypothetical protein